MKKVKLLDDDREWSCESVPPFTFSQPSDPDNWMQIEHLHLWRKREIPMPQICRSDVIATRVERYWVEGFSEGAMIRGVDPHGNAEDICPLSIFNIYRDGKSIWHRI